MHRYVIRRLLLFIPTIVLVSLLVFGLLRVLPGDVAVLILAGSSGEGHYTQEDLARVRSELGLNEPLHVQYARWLLQLVRLDLGTSLYNDVPVAEELVQRAPVTLELALVALVVSLIVALPLGVLMALRQDSAPDYILRVVSIGGLTFPPFWTGSLIILALVLVFRWTPPVGWTAPWEDLWRNAQIVVFPSLTMGYFYAALVARMTRSQMLEVLRQDYVRTAWAKGLRERAIVVRHALRNALLPVITVSAFQFGNLLGGTVIMEWLFTLPGIGSGLITSLSNRDYPFVQVTVVFIALAFLTINLLVDLFYGLLDPRIRYQ
ncbi:MAG: ABC transporter permease [Chloroflexota bacterium]